MLVWFSEGSPSINSGSIFKSKPILESCADLHFKTSLLSKIEQELIAEELSEKIRFVNSKLIVAKLKFIFYDFSPFLYSGIVQ